MRPDPEAIAGIRLKVTKASEHFDALNTEIEDWIKSDPITLVPDRKPDGSKHYLRVRYDKPIPVGWSITLGEAIHDLRSALDQTIFQLAIDHTGKVFETTKGGRRRPHWTGFPIYTSPIKFRNEGLPAIRRKVGDGPRTLIEQLQPYSQRRRLLIRHLLLVHDFWNQDKHRLTHLWGIRLVRGVVRVRQVTEPISSTSNRVVRRALRDGAIGVVVTCDPPKNDLQVQLLDGKFDVAIKNPRPPRRVPVFGMQYTVHAVVEALLGAIGHQADAISLPPDPPLI